MTLLYAKLKHMSKHPAFPTSQYLINGKHPECTQFTIDEMCPILDCACVLSIFIVQFQKLLHVPPVFVN